ncbi:MAG: tetratricopeptide repeat protein [Candidatus Omnitrophota bacterium]
MKRIIVFLGLGIIGCTTGPRVNKVTHQTVGKPKIALEANSIANTKPIPFDQKEVDEIIAVFSEAIQKNPNYAGGYYNRGIAYFHKNDYDKSWQDVHKAEALGCKFNANFLGSLKKASGREK